MSAKIQRRAMKDGLDRRAVSRLSAAILQVEPAFPSSQFERDSNEGLEQLELKARVAHVAVNLEKHLPADFRAALSIVLRAGESWPAGDFDDPLSEFSAWPLLDWVARAGLDDIDASLDALRRLTHLFSAELAIRPFILRDEQRALATLRRWTADSSEHVRRLVSEGTRPRLPWAPRLPPFQRDAAPVLELLEKLRGDPSNTSGDRSPTISTT